MHIEMLGRRRLRLVLESVPLELWLYLDPGHAPTAAWFDGVTGNLLAEVPVVGDDWSLSDQVRHRSAPT
jgi:hypothetical protein